MDTARVDICYRPLRLAWAIRSGDIEGFRRAVRLSYALWGGRFNPIVFADRDEEMRQLVELFRVDVVWPLCDEATAKQLEAGFLHLRNPFFHGPLFVEEHGKAKRSRLLDVFNAFTHLREKPEWQQIKESGVRLYRWHPTDPLTDVLLVQFGDYPAADEVGRDLRQTLIEAAEATEHTFEESSAISGEALNHASIPYFSGYGLERHYSVEAGWGWQTAGFFLGDAGNLDDLVCHWNLRAANIPLWFVDPRHLGRYAELIPAWEETSRQLLP